MADATPKLRGGKVPHLLYTCCHGTYKPDRIGGQVPRHWRYTSVELYDLETLPLDDVDVLLIPATHDQIFLKSIEAKLWRALSDGAHFFINGHIILPWLPCLAPFDAVPARPFNNWMIRPAEPGAYLGAMDFESFHRWEGVLGQYARGFSAAPAGAQWLSLIGGVDHAGPADWVWRVPDGGKVFMHNGDDIMDFCSDPRRPPCLFQDIVNALVFSDEPGPPPHG